MLNNNNVNDEELRVEQAHVDNLEAVKEFFEAAFSWAENQLAPRVIEETPSEKIYNEDPDNTVDVVGIGAGPVGLSTALQLKKRNPYLNIHMLEQHSQYKRTQELRLNVDFIDDEVIQDEIKKRIDDGSVKLNDKTLKISIQILEQILSDRAIALGIIIKNNITFGLNIKNNNPNNYLMTPEKLISSYPNCRTFIGCDGAHSSVRKLIFREDEEILERQDVQFLVEFKYSVLFSTDIKKLNYTLHGYATEKLAGFRCNETIKQNLEEKTTQIILRFIVDKTTYEKIGEVTFQKPLTQFRKLPEKLQKAISVWVNVREDVIGEKFIVNTGKLSKITLSVYSSKTYSITINKINWFLVGDAAFGVPFFRALHAGLNCSKKLTALLDSAFSRPYLFQTVCNDYNKYVIARYKKEAYTAREKNLGLDISKELVKISSKVPWQINVWGINSSYKFRHNIFLELEDPEKLAQALKTNYSFDEIRTKLVASIQNVLIPLRYQGKKDFFMMIHNEERRVFELSAVIGDCKDLEELKNVLAKFIRTGQTKSDKLLITYSPIRNPNSLRSFLIKILFQNEEANQVVWWSVDKIQNRMQLDTLPVKSDELVPQILAENNTIAYEGKQDEYTNLLSH
jgi:hypothetical protein